MPPSKIFKCLSDPELLEQLEDGDLLAWRGQSWVSRMIATAGRSTYTHVALLKWWDNVPMVCELREWIGGRCQTLQAAVDNSPGTIDVFKANPDKLYKYDRKGASDYMRSFAGRKYGYAGVLKLAYQHLPIVRQCAAMDMDDRYTDSLPAFCSQGVSAACRFGGGIDPVVCLADNHTEPGDLTRSIFFRYLATLQVEPPPAVSES